ncbi:MAG TPA: 3-hydroxyacyl-CoA dehydrogenase family protein [Thermoleophilaceae bacterium]|nr:3-hydroxyacyl-CoA dehydrogenase family protein [Thermoleophilaceae bacterium]
MRTAVLGAGTMGSGIAQAAAMAGHEVTLHDPQPAALARAGEAVRTSLDRFVRSERIAASEADAAERRIAHAATLADAVAEADVVVEAAPESLELKRDVFRAVVAAAPSEALLGTNTSQLSITAIGAAVGDAAERLVGMHFFNPPVMMRLVELVRGLATSDAALERAREFAAGLGKEVVVCRRDSPGFITTRAYAALRQECLRMLEEDVASPEDIDKALRLAFNFPMGPLELSDFNGIDVYADAVSALAEAHGERFRPPVGVRNMVAAGRLGRKAGHGFYRYDADGKRVEGSGGYG